MTSTKQQEIGIGTAVTYEDMANPLRRGEIVGEVAGGVQWAIRWEERDSSDVELYEVEGVRFHSTVTKHMLANAHERQIKFRERNGGSGRVGGWDAIVRPCAICGGEVTSPEATVDFCRMCFYTGTAWERMLRTDERDVLTRLGALDGVKDATVWHTGGGCFNLAVTLDDGRLLTPSMGVGGDDGTEIFAEPGIPDIAAGERWALVVSESEEAWSEWNEDKIEIPQRLFTDDELVAYVEALAKNERPLRNYVANVIGENLVQRSMTPSDDAIRPSDEGLLILYGDPESGITVVVAATDTDDAERRIIATFGDGPTIDCIDESTDQRPLSIRLVAGLVPNDEATRRLLALDAENAKEA